MPPLPSISIIIPVYNVEKYLVECLESILNQTYPHFEAILVNDGSTDTSPEIAQAYVNKDQRFVLLNKENGGQSSARNMGLKVANGDYVLYVDSDDYIALNSLENFVEVLHQYGEKEVIYGNYIEFDDVSKMEKPSCDIKVKTNEACQNLSGKDFILAIYPNHINHALWQNLYKRAFLINNNLLFNEDIVFEDSEIIYRLFFLIKSIGVLNSAFYHYRIRKNSTMTSNATPYKINSFISCIKTYFSHIEEVSHPLIQELLYQKIYLYLEKTYQMYQDLEKQDKTLLNNFHALRRKIPLSMLQYNSRALRIQQILFLKAPKIFFPLTFMLPKYLTGMNAFLRGKK